MRALPWAAGALCLLQLAVFLGYRTVSLDEGWYQVAAREITWGRIPYRDFSFTQTPLAALLYSPIHLLPGSSLLLARLLAAACGFGVILLTVRLARSRGGPAAGRVAWILLVVTIFFLAHMMTAVFYAPSTLLALAAFAVIDRPDLSRRRIAVGVVLLVFATMVRAMWVAALPGFLWIVVGASESRLKALSSTVGCFVAGVAAMLGPFLIMAPAALRYNLWEYHQRPGDSLLNMTASSALVSRSIHYAKDLTEAFPHVALLTAAAVVLAVVSTARGRDRRRGGWPYFLVAVCLGLVFTMPRGTSIHYACLMLPFCMIFIAAELGPPVARRVGSVRPAPSLVVILVLAGTVGLQQARLCKQRGLFRWTPGESGLRLPVSAYKAIHAASEVVGANTPESGEVLTLYPYVALEAKRPVTPTLEMSVFSFPTRGMSQERRDSLRLADPKELVGRVAQGIPDVIAIGDEQLPRYFEGEEERLARSLEEQYEERATIPHFSEYGQLLRIFTRRPPPEDR